MGNNEVVAVQIFIGFTFHQLKPLKPILTHTYPPSNSFLSCLKCFQRHYYPHTSSWQQNCLNSDALISRPIPHAFSTDCPAVPGEIKGIAGTCVMKWSVAVCQRPTQLLPLASPSGLWARLPGTGCAVVCALTSSLPTRLLCLALPNCLHEGGQPGMGVPWLWISLYLPSYVLIYIHYVYLLGHRVACSMAMNIVISASTSIYILYVCLLVWWGHRGGGEGVLWERMVGSWVNRFMCVFCFDGATSLPENSLSPTCCVVYSFALCMTFGPHPHIKVMRCSTFDWSICSQSIARTLPLN